MENEAKNSSNSSNLTAAQQDKIEKNRQKALLLKRSRVSSQNINDETVVKEKYTRYIDHGGGFLIEEEVNANKATLPKIIHEPGPVLESEDLFCDECGKLFLDSFLYDKFNATICEKCRDSEDKHRLITKTDAKTIYMLNDADIDKREPLLKFMLKKNPHKQIWAEMKLFLESQIAERALEVWGSEEAIEIERERRNEKKETTKVKAYNKKLKELRKQVRSSLWRKDDETHEHIYGEEVYNEVDDTYTKTCTDCGYSVSFEKM